MNDSTTALPRNTTLAVLVFIGGCFGLATGWGVGRLIKNSHLKDLSWSDGLALALSVALLAMGLGTSLLAVTPRGRAILANPRAPDYGRAITRPQVVYFWLQGAVLLLAGSMLATPVIMTGTLATVSFAWGSLTLSALALSFAFQTALNIAIWRRSDEVFRRVISESGAATFWAFQGVVFLWAAGEKLRVLPALSSWDIVAAMMALYLLASAVVSYRRGVG